MKLRICLAVSTMASSKQSATTTGFRLVSPRWADSALSGEGARKHGGRWNSAGTPLVYLSGSRALAALETLVHLTTPETRAKGFSLLEIGFPTHSIEVVPVAGLPPNWRSSPPTSTTMKVGDDWFASKRSLVLRVPSTLVAEEDNWLINPLHPRASAVTVPKVRTFSFDARLVG